MKELLYKIYNNALAVILAILVHATALAIIALNMDWHSPEPVAPPPVPVKAQAVEREWIEKDLARRAEEKKRRQEEQKRQQEEKRRLEKEKKIAAEKKRRQAEARQRKLAEEAEKKRRQEEARQRRLAEEAEKKRRQEEARKRKLADEAEKKRQALLAKERRQKAVEQQLLEAMEDEENQSKVQQLSALIQADVQNNWKIPPTARRGMECLLTVHLLPSGEVQTVQIARSSGDAVFDRSVQDAVYRASPLPVSSSSAGSRLFQTTFREFNFHFSPTNL